MASQLPVCLGILILAPEPQQPHCFAYIQSPPHLSKHWGKNGQVATAAAPLEI